MLTSLYCKILVPESLVSFFSAPWSNADRQRALVIGLLGQLAMQTDTNRTAIKDAFSAANLFMQDEEPRLAYVNREMAIMDYQSDMKAYREEGREEGRKEGRKEGLEEGHRAGEKAGIAKLVKNLVNAGTPIEYIRQASGWTDEAILALKN